LPEMTFQTCRIPLGVCQGLKFGVELRPLGTVEVYLEGKLARLEALARDHPGPRAVLNALDRMLGTYQTQCERIVAEISLARSQLQDFQARIGKEFSQEAYFSELTQLRDQLKAALAGFSREQEGKPPVSTAELAERIKTLRSSQQIEAALPVKRATSTSIATAEEPVTSRIRRRLGPSDVSVPPKMATSEIDGGQTEPQPANDGIQAASNSEPDESQETARSQMPESFVARVQPNEYRSKPKQLSLF
jgi:hypothetical protein